MGNNELMNEMLDILEKSEKGVKGIGEQIAIVG